MSPRSEVAKDVVEKIANFLKNDLLINRIHFRYKVGKPTYHFHSKDYRTIGDRIASGAILVTKERFEGAGKVGADYSPLHDRLNLQFPLGWDGSDAAKGHIVHEATHAIMDMHVWGDPNYGDFEVCGFLAGAVWSLETERRREEFYRSTSILSPHLAIGLPRGLTEITATPEQREFARRDARYNKNTKGADDIHKFARAIVRQYNMTTRRDVVLDRKKVVLLRQALSKSAVYRDSMNKMQYTDGIPLTRPDMPEAQLEKIRNEKYKKYVKAYNK